MKNSNKNSKGEHNQTSILDSLPKKNNFDIPDNYFENVKSEMIAKLTANTVSKHSKHNFKLKAYAMLTAAASIAFLYFWISNNPTGEITIANNTFSTNQQNLTISMLEETFNDTFNNTTQNTSIYEASIEYTELTAEDLYNLFDTVDDFNDY